MNNETAMAIHRITGMPLLQARDFVSTQPGPLIQKIIVASEAQSEAPLRDPIEADPAHSELVAAVRAEAEDIARRELQSRSEELQALSEQELAEVNIRGLCHPIWKQMKQILKEKHQIDWHSPAEMNPGSHFD